MAGGSADDRKTNRSGRSIRSLGKEFEPSEQTIRNWIKQSDLDTGRRTDGLTTEEREELRRLRREKWFASQTFSGSEMCRCLVEKFQRYSWPGNVRELKAVIQRLSVTVDDKKICGDHLELLGLSDEHADLDLETALENNDWNINATARAIGVARTTLYRRIKKLGLKGGTQLVPMVHISVSVVHFVELGAN